MTYDWNHPITGFLPELISPHDPRTVREQIESNYANGGGYNPVSGFTLQQKGSETLLRFPGDPPFKEVARTQIRDETVILFDCAFVAIVQPSGSLAVTRMD